MNFVTLFSERVVLAGIEVTDTSLRLLCLEPPKKAKEQAFVAHLGQVDLAPGTVVGSRVVDEKTLTRAIKELIHSSGFSGSYAVASIPSADVYSKVFTFPQSVTGAKLADAMALNAEFQSPISANDGYTSFERIDASDQNDVLFFAVSKTLVDAYLRAFDEAGLKLLALETHPQSFARALAPQETATLWIDTHATSASLSVLQAGTPRFTRNLHVPPFDKKTIAREEQRLRDFCEAKHYAFGTALSRSKAVVVAPFGNDAKIKRAAGTYAVALGAAMRGLLPRSEDCHVSLLPVGTEAAYGIQRANVVAEFLTTVTMALAVFFVAIFLGGWAYAARLENTTKMQLSGALAMKVPKDGKQLESRAQSFDQIVGTAAELIRHEPRWKLVLDSIGIATPRGITVLSLTLPAPEQTFTMSGIADTRATLVALRTALNATPLFTQVTLPLTNLDMKERIPFSITFRLADPSAIYPK